MILLVPLIVAAACWPTILALHERWTAWEETTYTHGWLIVAVTLYLLWRNRDTVRGVVPQLRAAPLATLLLLGLGWIFSVRAGVVSVEFFLLPLMLWFALWAAFGAGAARRNGFAVAYLYFAMPLWGAINWLPLWATVFVVRALLRIADIPVYFDGNRVQVPAGTFEIAGGCSGLHFLIVALAIAALMGELRGDDWRGRLKLLVLAGALAALMNWVRVFTIILAGHYSDMQHYLVARSHYGYGWVLFAVVMVVFFALERRMAAPAASSSPRPPTQAGSIHARALTVPGLMMAAVMGVVAALQLLSARPAPVQVQATTGSAQGGDDWQPVVHGADINAAEAATVQGRRVERWRYTFLWQRQGRELGAYSENPAGDLQIQASRRGRVGGIPVTLHEARDRKGGSWLLAVTYSVGADFHATAMPAKVRYAGASLLGLRSPPATVTVWRVSCTDDCRAAEGALDKYIAASTG